MEIPEIPEGKKPYYFPRRTILLVGGTGLVGKSVYKKFESEGHTIKMLSTNREYVDSHNLAYYWNVEKGIIDEKAIEDYTQLINLAYRPELTYMARGKAWLQKGDYKSAC